MEKITARYRYSVILLKQLVRTDFKLRYQGSILGYAWSLLRPLFLFVTLYVVFAKFLKVGDAIPHYPVYLLLGIVLWNYFIEITSSSVGSIVGKGDLIRKINFPKYIIVLAGCIGATINLALNAVIIAIFMAVTGVDIGLSALLSVPLIIELTLLGLGLGFILSTLFVRFRDVAYIWEVVTTAAFYATPILYPLSLAPEIAQKYLLLNPVAQIIQDMRHVLVTPETTTLASAWSPVIWLLPIGISILAIVAGGLYFKRMSKTFAEEV